VSVTCTTGSSSPKILLGQGQNATGGSDAAPARRMKANTGDYLEYFLYQDESQTVWGNTSGTGKAVPTPDGAPHVETIYGEVSLGQNKPVGQYADTVIVSVVF
jgi:spore coat protein U-like protein